jgi:hypothetical protein
MLTTFLQKLIKRIKMTLDFWRAMGYAKGDQEESVMQPFEKDLLGELNIDPQMWDIFRNSIAEIESGGKYDIFGGANNHYDGRYQLGEAAKADASRILGIDNPGHTPEARQAFRNSPEMQEQLFAGFTLANHKYLMKNSDKYKNATPEQKLQILGYAHNQGMGGAAKFLETGEVGSDAFGTQGTKYADLIGKNLSLASAKPKDMTLEEFIRL